MFYLTDDHHPDRGKKRRAPKKAFRVQRGGEGGRNILHEEEVNDFNQRSAIGCGAPETSAPSSRPWLDV